MTLCETCSLPVDGPHDCVRELAIYVARLEALLGERIDRLEGFIAATTPEPPDDDLEDDEW